MKQETLAANYHSFFRCTFKFGFDTSTSHPVTHNLLATHPTDTSFPSLRACRTLLFQPCSQSLFQIQFMNVLRFNPFGQVHKGLRALLYDTALLLQHINFSKEEEIAIAVERIKLVNNLFAHHAEIEDGQVFPMIAKEAPEIVADFEAQHETDHLLSAQLEKKLHLFNETNSPEQNRFAGNELLQSFNAFLAFNVEHMRKEETIVNGCLWKTYTDEELLKKVQEISAAIPPEENKHFACWMLRGMATHEIIDWYNAVKHSAPKPVFTMLCDLAEEVLPEKKWDVVKEALQEGALLA